MIWFALWAMFLLGFLAHAWWAAWCADRREADERAWALQEFAERIRRRFEALAARRN